MGVDEFLSRLAQLIEMPVDGHLVRLDYISDAEVVGQLISADDHQSFHLPLVGQLEQFHSGRGGDLVGVKKLHQSRDGFIVAVDFRLVCAYVFVAEFLPEDLGDASRQDDLVSADPTAQVGDDREVGEMTIFS